MFTFSFTWIGRLMQVEISSAPVFKDTLKAFNEFKNMQKSIWTYVYMCFLISESIYIQYTVSWDNTQMLKKINSTKNVLLFLLQAPTHHSVTFNMWSLYKLKRNFRLTKTVCEIFHFRFSTKCMDSLTLKHYNSFQN